MYSPTSNAYPERGKGIGERMSDFLEFCREYKMLVKNQINYYLSEEFDNINNDELEKELREIANAYFFKVRSDFFEKYSAC